MIVRNLCARLGLAQDSPQLRIIGDQRVPRRLQERYLEDFFGMPAGPSRPSRVNSGTCTHCRCLTSMSGSARLCRRTSRGSTRPGRGLQGQTGGSVLLRCARSPVGCWGADGDDSVLRQALAALAETSRTRSRSACTCCFAPCGACGPAPTLSARRCQRTVGRPVRSAGSTGARSSSATVERASWSFSTATAAATSGSAATWSAASTAVFPCVDPTGRQPETELGVPSLNLDVPLVPPRQVVQAAPGSTAALATHASR